MQQSLPSHLSSQLVARPRPLTDLVSRDVVSLKRFRKGRTRQRREIRGILVWRVDFHVAKRISQRISSNRPASICLSSSPESLETIEANKKRHVTVTAGSGRRVCTHIPVPSSGLVIRGSNVVLPLRTRCFLWPSLS